MNRSPWLRDWVLNLLVTVLILVLLLIVGLWIASFIESLRILKVIISVTAIVSGLASITSAYGDVVDKNPNSIKRGLDKITVRGWIYFTSTVVLMLMPILQNLLQEKIDDAKDLLSEQHQDERYIKLKSAFDSINNKTSAKYDTAYLRTTSTIAETLGKYGFRLDSTNKLLVNTVRDSSNPSIIPAVRVDSLIFTGHDNRFDKYRLEINSHDAGCKIRSLRITTLASKFRSYYKLYEINPMDSLTILPKDAGQIQGIVFPNDKFYTAYHVWISGSYESLDKRFVLPIDIVFTIDAKTHDYTIAMGVYKIEIRQNAKSLNTYLMPEFNR